jgi:hypothetical protein
VTWTLALIVLAGLVMRVWFLIVYHPALIGVSDTANYLIAAQTKLFYDPDRVAGYVLFLRLLHLVWPRLIVVAIVQHALGLVGGVLLFDAVRRARLPRALGLVPAAVVILSGYMLILEHAVLTDAPFIFLVELSIWLTVRAWRGSRWWSFATGLCLGVATVDRTVGLELLPVALGCLVLAPDEELTRRTAPDRADSRNPDFADRPTRVGPAVRRFLSSHRVACWRAGALAVGVVGALLAMLPFLIAHDVKTGVFNFTSDGNLALYGRVAPWADCTKFTPPPGTSALCPRQPVSQRLGAGYWKFEAPYPITTITGWYQQTPAGNAKMGAFAEAAIEGEPLTYLEYVARGLARVVDPSFSESPNPAIGNAAAGDTEEQSVAEMFNPVGSVGKEPIVAAYYKASKLHMGDASWIVSWASDTRLVGPAMVVVLLLALASPFLAKRLPRRFALLGVAYSFVLIVGPNLVADYDYRYAAPAFGPLSAAAAIGAYELARRMHRRLRGGEQGQPADGVG